MVQQNRLSIILMHRIHQTQHHKEENMTKKQSRLEKVRKKNIEVEQFPKVEEKIEESPKEEEIMVETIPKVEPVTKTYLVKDILIGRR